MFKFTKVVVTKCDLVINSPKFAPTKVSLYTVGEHIGLMFLSHLAIDSTVLKIVINGS